MNDVILWYTKYWYNQKLLIMKYFYLILLTLIISSCATSYQRKAYHNGYSDLQMDKNLFQVAFKGNSHTSMERAVDYALLRASEITLDNDFRYFSIIKGDRYVVEDFHHYIFSHPTHRYAKPRVNFKIRCYNEKSKKYSYDAVILENSVKGKYNIKR